MPAKPIPEGHHSVTAYLIVADAAKAIDFYQRAFGATEAWRLADPSGKVGHAEIKIGDSMVMLADEFPDMGIRGPQSYGGSPASMLIYTEDVDSLFRQALAAGATEVRPVKDQFYGDRSGTLKDPFGHSWSIATHTEDVSTEEIQRRFADFVQQQGKE